jgi:sugar lactone lactonase YvrE
MTVRFCFFLTVVCLAPPQAVAQRPIDYDYSVVRQVRVDLRDLGYPPVDVIPADESAIRSLAVAPNGALYGATSGRRSHLFVLFPVHGYVQPLGYLEGVNTVHHSLVVSRTGDVYLGTSAGVDNGGEGYDKYPGGHLLRYQPDNDERKPLRVDAPCPVADLGVPVAGEGVYSLAIDRERNVIYGLTYPNGHFFSYSIATGKFAVHGKVAEKLIPGEKFEKEKNISRALAVDSSGDVFASGEDGFLYRFRSGEQRLERLGLRAPTAPGREPYNRVDAWTEDGRGILYGGTSDGYLFRLDPKSLTLRNLGKPLNQYRIRGLVWAPGGRLYGAGGDDDEMVRLFSYDPATGEYELLGFLDVNRRPYYSWHAYVVDAMAIGDDGTIYIGQAERISKLYLFYPVVSWAAVSDRGR